MATLTVVVAVAIAAAGWWRLGGGSEQWARWHWQPPQQKLLSAMEVEPVPGWRSSVTDLGLPLGATISTDGDGVVPGPVIMTSSSRVYLLAKTAESTSPQWWLAGMDASDGRPSFPPVALNGTQRPPSCYANGDAVVCISEESRAATAWVIDGESGKLTHTGPTDLSLYSSKLRPTQVGGYLVAQTEKEGVYGVGPNAEPTWFVPGVGIVASHDDALAFQSRGEGLGGNVFTLADGRIVRPELAPEARLQTVRFFDGGFAAEVAIANDPAVVKLFDTNARVVADTPGSQVAGTTADLIAAFDDDQWAIFTSDGARLLNLPREEAGGVRLIGSSLWVATGGASSRRIQPYDLRTGDRGKPCNVDLSGYLGSDGTVALRASLNPRSDDVAQAYDLTTCGMVWSIPRPAGSVGELVRIGDTLIRLSDDGTELTSLVAPS